MWQSMRRFEKVTKANTPKAGFCGSLNNHVRLAGRTEEGEDRSVRMRAMEELVREWSVKTEMIRSGRGRGREKRALRGR